MLKRMPQWRKLEGVHVTLEKLRRCIYRIEEAERRFSRTVSVARAIDLSLPFQGLPCSCIHEVKGTSLSNALAFSALLSARISRKGYLLYIGPDCSMHPAGLLPYGVDLNRVLHVDARRFDLAWTVMEALRCSEVSAVIAVLNGLDLTQSRRLQLAAEASGATAFLIGHAQSAPIASPITRWRVSSIAGHAQHFDEPVWAVDLLYCRGGRPGSWILEWRGQELHTVEPQPVIRQKDQPTRLVSEALAG